jgi:hypothetical protein
VRKAIVGSLALIAAVGCGAQPSPQANQSPAQVGTQSPAQVAKAPCDNTYVPVKAGAQWTYKNTSSATKTLIQVATITDVDDRAFTEKVTMGDSTTWTETWSCVDGGLLQLQNNGGPAGAALGPHGKATITTTSNTGITIPTDPHAGDAWSQVTEGVIKGGGLTLTQKTELTSRAVGMESVTVPAGTFQALRIDGQSKVDVTNQDGSKMHFTGTTSVWVVAGKGVVKSVSTFASVDTTSELETVQIP